MGNEKINKIKWFFDWRWKAASSSSLIRTFSKNNNLDSWSNGICPTADRYPAAIKGPMIHAFLPNGLVNKIEYTMPTPTTNQVAFTAIKSIRDEIINKKKVNWFNNTQRKGKIKECPK